LQDTSTRGRILSSAERLFAEHGFNGVSMPMIAKASGITAGAIYKHFDGKADLFFEVVQRTVQSTSMPHATENTSDVMLLPQALARYSLPELKLLRQLALEVHAASVKHPKVRRLLRRSVDQRIQQIGTSIAAAQRARKADHAVDAELLAAAVMVFTMGLMHMETIAPRLVGDAEWQDFVRDRVAAMLGVSDPG
jgi:AcrR family transcriptional regulator